MATKKYFTENGIRAFPTDSIPHSKLLSLFADDLFGPKRLEPNIVKATNPTARILHFYVDLKIATKIICIVVLSKFKH